MRATTFGALWALGALGLLGCPSTAPSPVQIARVEIVGDPASNDFVLRVTGTGFGPTSVTYDLSSGKGTAVTELSLEIFDSLERLSIPVPREAVTIESARSFDARVTNSPLDLGSYGIRIFLGASERPVVVAPDVFRVGDAPDAGEVVDAGDAGDSGVAPPPDTGIDGGIVPPIDAGDAGVIAPDAEPVDTGVPPDAGLPPDSGLGPWVGTYQFRQPVELSNTSAAPAPTGTTIRVPIPHQFLFGIGRAKTDATDLALYAGTTRLDHQWDDATKIGTDALMMVAALPADAPVGTSAPLVLYYGDPSVTVATVDSVFTFVQRFRANLPGAWRLNNWYHCNFERPTEAQTMNPGAFCIDDDNNANPVRRTLGSPTQPAITRAIAANQVYEVSFWYAGQMEQQNNDLFYFAFGPDPAVYDDTTLIPASAWVEGPPNVASFTFTETDGSQRTVEGWRLPAGSPQWWTRARGRFVPGFDAPSLHFRFISKDGVDYLPTGMAIDDWTIRVALEPELGVTLGAVEVR
ncbi:hypothetical protein L6R52_40745 [Myxococcota bacterium]|nr:hypothetical protein [Myxococcota bacterium]